MPETNETSAEDYDWGAVLNPEQESTEETETEETETEAEGDETEADVEEESEEEEEADEETDSESEEDEEAEEETEEVNPLAAINDNLKKAVDAERAKRKARDVELKEIKAELELASNDSEADKTLESVLKQLKDQDLLEYVKVDKPKKRDPEVQALLDSQKQAREQERIKGLVTDMQQEVATRLPEFSAIDSTSNEQAQILGKLILTSVEVGNMDMEDAVGNALTDLNTLLETNVKSFKQKRQPKVKPTKKTKTATRVKKAPTSKAKKFNDGDVDGFFNDVGGKLLGE